MGQSFIVAPAGLELSEWMRLALSRVQAGRSISIAEVKLVIKREHKIIEIPKGRHGLEIREIIKYKVPSHLGFQFDEV